MNSEFNFNSKSWWVLIFTELENEHIDNVRKKWKLPECEFLEDYGIVFPLSKKLFLQQNRKDLKKSFCTYLEFALEIKKIESEHE